MKMAELRKKINSIIDDILDYYPVVNYNKNEIVNFIEKDLKQLNSFYLLKELSEGGELKEKIDDIDNARGLLSFQHFLMYFKLYLKEEQLLEKAYELVDEWLKNLLSYTINNDNLKLLTNEKLVKSFMKKEDDKLLIFLYLY